MGIQHFAVAFTLVLINPLQRAVVQHAILAIATLHLQRGVGHCLATAGINKRGAVSQGRTGANAFRLCHACHARTSKGSRISRKAIITSCRRERGKAGQRFNTLLSSSGFEESVTESALQIQQSRVKPGFVME